MSFGSQILFVYILKMHLIQIFPGMRRKEYLLAILATFLCFGWFFNVSSASEDQLRVVNARDSCACPKTACHALILLISVFIH